MNYFKKIESLSDLKKQYRALAFANHPDRGGSTEVMQQINLQFEQLFTVWEHAKTSSEVYTGYEDDNKGSSAKEYADYVYNEYRWCGKNYKGQCNKKIIEIIRCWLKETYPRYRFSVRRKNYDSFYVDLINADFVVFTPQYSNLVYKEISIYGNGISRDERLTDRAKEVMQNVCEFIISYNYDDSDSMTDYFNTNFYLHLGIGNYKNPYKIVTPKLKCRKSDLTTQFKHPEGKAHKAIRLALGKNLFSNYDIRKFGNITVLGYENYNCKGEKYFYPLIYSSRKTAQKRIDKLQAAGIECSLTGYNGGCILFSGYTEETQQALEKERQEEAAARYVWNIIS